MSSWAQVAAQPKLKAADQLEGDWQSKVDKVCVVDANAIISGIRLEKLGDVAVTLPEVMGEVRDQKSREYLQQLPFGIKVMSPEAQHVKRVAAFARATGDLQVLSEVDLKLLALCLQLEIQFHGSDSHIRQQPVPAKVKGKKRGSKGFTGSKLPGWDYVRHPEDWLELDQKNSDSTSTEHQGQSRILPGQQLLLDQEQLSTTVDESIGTNEFSFGFDASVKQDHLYDDDDDDSAEIEIEFELTDDANTPIRLIIYEIEFQDAQDFFDESEERAYFDELSQDEHFEEVSDENEEDQKDEISEYPDVQQLNNNVKDDGGWQVAYSSNNARRRKERKQRKWEKRQQEATTTPSCTVDSESQHGAPEEEFGSQVSDSGKQVQCVTADYAMQNVLLQLGLKLSTPDGKRISELKKWVLRCSACFMVVKESGRIFCPKCGKAALENVEVRVGANGAEFVGMRKRHILRGTRFSLPKPKQGRYANNPILSEDELMLQVQKLKNSSRLKTGKAKDDTDPFAPEYGEDTWHQMAIVREGASVLNTSALNTNWRKNPNARKNMPRSNRRK